MRAVLFIAVASILTALAMAGPAQAQTPPGCHYVSVPGAGRTLVCTGTPGAGPQAPDPSVCFYSEPNYKGARFCESGSRTVRSVPAPWRDIVKSVKINENATVWMCPEDTLQGTCETTDSSVTRLVKGLYNHLHSYRILKKR